LRVSATGLSVPVGRGGWAVPRPVPDPRSLPTGCAATAPVDRVFISGSPAGHRYLTTRFPGRPTVRRADRLSGGTQSRRRFRPRLREQKVDVSTGEPGDGMRTVAIRTGDRSQRSRSAGDPGMSDAAADDITVESAPDDEVVVFEARDVSVQYSGNVAVQGVTLDV